MVTPNAIPRGMMVTLCTGSEFGSLAATRAWPPSWYAVTFFSSSVRMSDLRSAPVEATRAEQGRIEDIRTVGRRHQDDAFVRFEAVHLNQQLIQGLFALVVPAA